MSLLGEQFLKHLENNPNKIFFYTFGEKIRGDDCFLLIKKITSFLQKESIESIAISSRNSIFWPIAYIASKIVAKDVFIFDPSLPQEFISNTIERCSIDCTFNDIDFSEGFNSESILINSQHIGTRLLTNGPNDILFTSGTTSESKGVIIPESAYAHVASTLIKKLNQQGEDLELLSMPFFHSFGLTRLRTAFIAGNSSFISDGLKNFPEIYKFSKTNPFSGLSMVPSAIEIIRGMLKSKAGEFVSSVRYLEIGSSAISHNSRIWLKENFTQAKIIHHYGMTESSRAFIRDRGLEDDFDIDDSWLGAPLDGCSYKILDDKEEGELLLRGKNLFSGYLNNELTKSRMLDGWLKTGDICKLTKGMLFLTGRTDNQINIGGEKVQAEKIESIIETLALVKGCICFGVDDKILGSKIAAILELENIKETNNNNELKIHIDTVFKKYPSFYKPSMISVVDKLPLTHNGKKIRNPSLF